jgi:hypothetical protein
MKKIKLGMTIIFLSMIYWVIYNTYFGWNATPINDSELMCDNLFKTFVTVGWCVYFLPLLDVYESFIKKHESKS